MGRAEGEEWGLLDYGMRKELPRDEACQERREGTGCGLGIEVDESGTSVSATTGACLPE